MKRTHGFTVIELLVVIVFLGIASTVLFAQRASLNATSRDESRKTAVNAMYYNLEEVYFAKHKAYPLKIDSTVLTAMDPELFTDPNGIAINEAEANYRYQGSNCDNTACKQYTLRTTMEKEADFVKTSRQQ